MHVYCSGSCMEKCVCVYICIYITVFLFSRQLFKNMAAYFLSYQAACQTQILLALNALPSLSWHVHGLLTDLSFAPAHCEFPSCRAICFKFV